jgi:four helix bundle protein
MRFEELDVWKRGTRLCVEIYRYLRELKDYGFKDQITLSSLSIPSNIAEGFERNSQKECITFLSYAKGSCGELRTQTHIAMEIGYIDCATGGKWLQEAEEISHMLGGLIKTKKGFAVKQERGSRK